MAPLIDLPRSRLPLLVLAAAGLVATTSWLQGRFVRSDVRKGIALALAHRPVPAAPTVFDRLVALGQGDPRCDGEVVSGLLGDVRVTCATPARPEIHYVFRVLIGGERPPRPDGEAAGALLEGGPR
ncbi:MAG TPA: hypothetical protein VFP65_10035 [Anaeromyxobacteraceae bacterium]|nr:hypothetical protein [Anaeromyxobacteraceae bacterium]